MPRWLGPPVCFACGPALCYWVFTADLCLGELLALCIYWVKTEATSSELESEKPREVFQSKLLALFISMNKDSYLLEKSPTVLLRLVSLKKEAVSQIQPFGKYLYKIISGKRRGMPPHQSLSLLIYMSFSLMGSLPPLEILLLTTNKVHLCMCYYVTSKSCFFESQIYCDSN